MRPTTHNHVRREQQQLSTAGHGLEGHADPKVMHNAANCSIVLVGMLPDSIAMKLGLDP